MSIVLTAVIINYNQGEYFAQCFQSVANQSFRDFELLVIDDCSSDNSVELIQRSIGNPPFYCEFIVNEINKGICFNLNLALSKAKGKYFTFIAADDWGSENRFEHMIDLLEEKDESFALCYGDATLVNKQGELIADSYLKVYRPDLATPPEGDVFNALLNDNFIPAMATIIRTNLLREVGGFDNSLKVEDYDMWLRLSAKYKFIYDNNSICYYRILDNSLIRRIGPVKYEDWIKIYLKHLNLSPAYNMIIKKKIATCCEFLYYTGSRQFTVLYKKCKPIIGKNYKLSFLNLLHGLGVKGGFFKSISNKLQGRKQSFLNR